LTSLNMPINLEQRRLDGVTAIPVGGTIPEATAQFRATVPAVDPTLGVRLQIEVQPVLSVFTGVPSAQSPFQSSAGVATVVIDQLTSGPKHWRARLQDTLGRSSDWVSFGNNADGVPDFVIASPSSGGDPGAASPSSRRSKKGGCSSSAQANVSWLVLLIAMLVARHAVRS
jgi:hypothetical protein